MTNTELLRAKIDESGYKLQYVAKQIGLTYAGFANKLSGESEFKISEVNGLVELLKLTSDDMNKIFFAADME